MFLNIFGSRGSVVVKALCYKPVACSIPDDAIFLIYLILPDALGPRVYSAPDRNEYRKHTNNDVSVEQNAAGA
jgi:hypothetical protein